ncbi:MAG: ABC transporter ATP-binding protein [Thermoplasmata archaeon]
MLKVENVHSGYGDIEIIKGVSFEIKNNETKVLLALNGSGKTTLLKTLSGILPVKEGRIILNNEDITTLNPRERTRRKMLYAPEWGVFPELSVYENLIVASSISQKNVKNNINDVIKLFPELSGKVKDRAASLSGGQRKMLIIAMAIVSGANLLLLDEPSSGLSPLYVEKLIKTINKLKNMGFSFLIAEQNSSFTKVADSVMIMDLGKIIFEGNKEEILKNEEIKKKFFSL